MPIRRFRLVSLHIQALCDPGLVRTDAQVMCALRALPTALNEAYDIVLGQISALQYSGPDLASKALIWLLSAVQPLKTADFIAAIVWEPPEYCPPQSQVDILRNYCNLVVHDKEQDVRFAHLSAQDYLEGRDEFTSFKNHSYSLDRCLDTIQSSPPSA